MVLILARFIGMSSDGLVKNDLLKFDTAEMRWSVLSGDDGLASVSTNDYLPPRPSPRFGCTLMAMDSELYLYGGTQQGTGKSIHQPLD